MKVLGLISAPLDPASRVRIAQYEIPLEQYGIQLQTHYSLPLRDSDPPSYTKYVKRATGINEWRLSNAIKTISRYSLLIKQHRFNVIWQNRLILPHSAFFEKRWKKPLVFDFDDAVWLTEGRDELASALKTSEIVFAGNEYLADFATIHNKNVFIIPTTADTDRLVPGPLPSKFTLGWIGTQSNFPYLDLIKPSINDFLSKHADARFMVVSSTKPTQFNFDEKQFLFREWSEISESDLINEFTVGLMPLPDNDWTKGKCGYKILQYMSCGRPVVVSPTGINNQLIIKSNAGLMAGSDTEWLDAFEQLKNEPLQNRQYADNGREFVLKHYSVKAYTPIIAAHLQSLTKISS
jgi:glycosyltransferase involved in cell wall biosynthesis